jgi:hypothetical protein
MLSGRYKLPDATMCEADWLRSENFDIADMNALQLFCERKAVEDALGDLVARQCRERNVWVDGRPIGEIAWLMHRHQCLLAAQKGRRHVRC